MVAAMVAGLVVCAGVSTSSPMSFFFTHKTAMLATTATTATTGAAPTLERPMLLTQEASASATAEPADYVAEEDFGDASSHSSGFGLPLVLASLSVLFLGLASWIIRPKQHFAMAAMSASRQPLQAVEDATLEAPEKPITKVGSAHSMLTPLGYYEAYELVVVMSPKLGDLEKDDRLSGLEALLVQNQCKKVEKLDRGRRLLAYPMRGSIEAYILLYTFKGPRTMPKLINNWFCGPGMNTDGAIFRCNVRKQRRVKKGGVVKVQAEEEMPWSL